MSGAVPAWLAVMRCPHGVLAVSLDDAIGGHRLTSSKCCGRWTTVQRWQVDLDELMGEIATEASEITQRHLAAALPPVKCDRCPWVGTEATTSSIDGCHYCPDCGYSVTVPRPPATARKSRRRSR